MRVFGTNSGYRIRPVKSRRKISFSLCRMSNNWWIIKGCCYLHVTWQLGEATRLTSTITFNNFMFEREHSMVINLLYNDLLLLCRGWLKAYFLSDTAGCLIWLQPCYLVTWKFCCCFLVMCLWGNFLFPLPVFVISCSSYHWLWCFKNERQVERWYER